LGARGLVSVLGSAYPESAAELVRAALEGRPEEAARLQAQLRPLIEALFHETNPIPLKALLHRLGLCSDRVRLPLLPASPGTRMVLSAAVHRAQVA
jgi:4-hydroxy-tetrahydrodipicolinate synthase